MTRQPARTGRPVVAYDRDTATWVSFGALFGFGLLNATLGPILPYLRVSEQLGYVAASLHQVAFAVGGMTAGLLATRSNADRRRVIVVGLVGAACAGLLLGYGGLFAVTLGAAYLVSAFATSALIRIWALLADLHRRTRAVAMTEGEVSVSLAGIVTPAVVSVCAAAAVSWRFSLVIAFVVVVLGAVAVGVVRLPDAAKASASDGDDDRDDDRDAAVRDTGSPVRSLATIFAVVGLEFALSFWAASYLHDDVGLGRDAAVALVSALYAANLLGRLVVSRLARRMAAATVLRLSLATALLGTPLLLVAGNAVVAAVGLAVAGAGIGGTFPLASALHVAASGRTADQALGQILTVAGIGEITGPLVVGLIAQGAGLRLGLLVLPALVLLGVVTTRPPRTSRTPA